MFAWRDFYTAGHPLLDRAVGSVLDWWFLLLAVLALDVIAWVWGNWSHPIAISWEGGDSGVVKGSRLAKRSLVLQVCVIALILIGWNVFGDRAEEFSTVMPQGHGVGSELWIVFVVFCSSRWFLTRFVDRAPVAGLIGGPTKSQAFAAAESVEVVCRVVLVAGAALAVALYCYIAWTSSLLAAIVFGVTANLALFVVAALVPVGLPAWVPLLGVIGIPLLGLRVGWLALS